MKGGDLVTALTHKSNLWAFRKVLIRVVKFRTPQVFKRENGTKRISVRYTDPSFLGVRSKSKKLPKDTAKARNEIVEALKAEILAEIKTAPIKKITFEKLTEQFIAYMKKTQVRNSTFKSRSALYGVMNRTFGKQVVSTITSVQLNRYLDDLLYKKNLANSSVTGYRTALSALFKYGLKFGYLSDNPLTKVSLNLKDEKAAKRARFENYYLSDNELKTVLDICQLKHRLDYYDLFYWLYLTGMRIGEAVSLTPEDIFQENGIYYAKVHGTMIETEEKGWIKQEITKTIAGMRNVSLPRKAVEIYQRAISDENNPTEFLFYSHYKKGPFNPHNAYYFLIRMQKKFGLRKFGTHIFRHTHISKLAEEGYSLNLISKRVGHYDSEITRKIYLHITKKTQNKFDESIQNFG